MLMRARESALLVVDVQERLLGHIHDWQRILENVIWLGQVAQRLEVPVMMSEQYPKGLGHTVAEVTQVLSGVKAVEKLHFSCVAAGCLDSQPGMERKQIVVCGIEAHVCVLQTALDLQAAGKQVYVVADAVGSRSPDCRQLALERMRDSGVQIVHREMVAFEWLHQAGTEAFREISTRFLR